MSDGIYTRSSAEFKYNSAKYYSPIKVCIARGTTNKLEPVWNDIKIEINIENKAETSKKVKNLRQYVNKIHCICENKTKLSIRKPLSNNKLYIYFI